MRYFYAHLVNKSNQRSDKLSIDLEQEVEVTCVPSNINYWRKLRYKPPKIFDKFLVKAKNLSNKSNAKIIYTCDICGKNVTISLNNYNKKKSKIDQCFECHNETNKRNAKYTYFYVYDFFKKENCTLVSTEYISYDEKLQYTAQCGHGNSISFGKFKNGAGRLCGKCALIDSGKKHKHTYEYIQQYFKDNGCVLLSDEYNGQCEKLRYTAQCGHEYETTFNAFQQGRNRLCEKCNIEQVAEKQKK